MPPKKGKAKPKRIPHANETPLKHKQPGHGAVERAKNQMWHSEPSNSAQSTRAPGSAGSSAPPVRPKYKATASTIGAMGIGIRTSRGGGVGSTIKKKAPAVVVKKVVSTPSSVPKSSDGTSSANSGTRANPDSNFFSKPTI